jgi:MFS family permease
VPAQRLSSTDLIELTSPFPRAHHYAVRAHDAKIAAIIMTAFGAAALAGSFIAGFAVDRTTNEAQAGFYSAVGVTIALGVGSGFIAWPVASVAHRRSIVELADEVNRYCPQ